jgi:general secretion pathway protein D
LKDGETATFTGLIRDDDVSGAQKVPGLGDLPILGRLFQDRRTATTKTEIVLQITPRIVRNIRQQMPSITEMVSGSETSLKARLPGQRSVVEAESVPLGGSAGSPAARPAAPPRPATAPAAAPAASPTTPPEAAPAPSPVEGAQEPAAATSGQAVTLSLEGSPDVKVGQEFIVALMAQADQPLLSTAIQVSYDAQALRVVEVSEGDLMKQEGAQTNFSHKVDPATGKIFLGLSRAGATGASGRGNLVMLKFAAQGEKPKAPVGVAVFSGVGTGNRLLPAALPAPLDIKVSP